MAKKGKHHMANTETTFADHKSKLLLGRKVPSVIHPHLKLKNYLEKGIVPGNAFESTLVAPPAAHTWVPKNKAFGIHNALGNDYDGDCTDAAAGHILDIWNYWAKDSLPPVTQAQAIAFAKANGSLNGGYLQNVLAFWQANGYLLNGSDNIAGYAGVDVTDQTTVKFAIWAFGNCYTGVSLPEEWVNSSANIQNGFVWDVAGVPDPNNGHCVPWIGYNATGVVIDTWGFIGTITWAAVEKYFASSAGGEVYTVFSKNWLNNITALAPSGFNATQLQADLTQLTT